MPTKEQDAFITGGIIAILGLYQLAFPHDLQGGFFLLGVGVVIMASVSEDFRGRLFGFFLSVFEGLWHLVSNL